MKEVRRPRSCVHFSNASQHLSAIFLEVHFIHVILQSWICRAMMEMQLERPDWSIVVEWLVSMSLKVRMLANQKPAFQRIKGFPCLHSLLDSLYSHVGVCISQS